MYAGAFVILIAVHYTDIYTRKTPTVLNRRGFGGHHVNNDYGFKPRFFLGSLASFAATSGISRDCGC